MLSSIGREQRTVKIENEKQSTSSPSHASLSPHSLLRTDVACYVPTKPH